MNSSIFGYLQQRVSYFFFFRGATNIRHHLKTCKLDFAKRTETKVMSWQWLNHAELIEHDMTKPGNFRKMQRTTNTLLRKSSFFAHRIFFLSGSSNFVEN